MNLSPYREALANPGVKPLLAVSLAMRLPFAAMAMVFLFHVRFGLGMTYFQAGAVTALLTVGFALSGPVKGRLVDRIGPRPVIAVTTAGSTVFFAASTVLPYPVLLPVAFLGGLVAIPVFVVRQALTALVPAGRRKPIFALDAICVELAFVIAPAVGILVATWNSRIALLGVAALSAVAGGFMYVLDPPARSPEDTEAADGERPAPREWLTRAFAGLTVGALGFNLALAGAEVSLVAVLKTASQERQASLVVALWAAYSVIGGFLYGTLRRGYPPLAMLTVMCVLITPFGLFSDWWVFVLLLIPVGMLIAPVMAAFVESVTTMTPASVHGEALGVNNGAVTIGGSLGAPFAGAVIDVFGPGWGFVAAGGGGALLAVMGLLLMRAKGRGAGAARAGEPLAGAA